MSMPEGSVCACNLKAQATKSLYWSLSGCCRKNVSSWRLSTIVEEVIIKLTPCSIETAGPVRAVRFIGPVHGSSDLSEQRAKMVQERDNLGCDVMWVTAKTPKPKREQQWSSWRERWRQANNYGKELSTRESSDCRRYSQGTELQWMKEGVRSRRWILDCSCMEFSPLGSRKLTRGGLALASLVVNLTTPGIN